MISVKFRQYPFAPQFAQLGEPRSEDFQRVVHVQDVLRAVLGVSSREYENLLGDETHWVRDPNLCRDFARSKVDWPRVVKENLHIPQPLRGDT